MNLEDQIKSYLNNDESRIISSVRCIIRMLVIKDDKISMSYAFIVEYLYSSPKNNRNQYFVATTIIMNL